MAGKDWILDPASLNYSHVVADIEAIRQVNSQRGAMEHLTAIIYDDSETNTCAGYLDVTDREFWVPGHMPGMPLMPGVIICEAAAQVCSYHATKHKLLGDALMGFGALDEVRFRGAVVPGDRLTLMCQKTKLRRGRIVMCRFQAFVGTNLVCEGKISGIPLPTDMLRNSAASDA